MANPDQNNPQFRRLERVEADWPVIPGYTLESVIGRGSTGTVYRALQTAVEREVAIKVLHPDLVAKPRVVERLRREARTLARLHHPHLISAIDMGQQDGRWWFAMEFVDGPSLAEWIRAEGPLTEREALRLFLPLCEALEALWEGGVVHRDIKPANVLLERGPRGGIVRARLADLGLAFAGDDPGLTGQGGTLGTPHYISPEQARDPSGVDIRTDIWSFGATLFHALCGRPPFTGESMAEVLSAVLHGRVPDPQRLAPHLGRGMALVVRRCLVREPGGRYQDPPELLADLERLRERRAPAVTRAQLDPLERRGPGWLRRLGLIAGTSAILATSAVVVLERLTDPEALPSIADERGAAPLLERLVGQVERRPSRLAGAWLELAGLRDQAPGDLLWLEIRAELLAHLDRALSAALVEHGAEVDEQLRAADYDSARELLDDEALSGLLRSATGFGLDELPTEAARRLDAWRAERSALVASALENRAAAFTDGVLRYRDELLVPELERQVERGRFREAFATTELDGRELVLRAGLDPALLPPDELEAATVETRVRLDVERVAVERAWRRTERELLAWIEDQVELRRSAAEMLPLGGTLDVDLAAGFATELERRALRREDLPLGAGEEFDRQLAAGREELERADRGLATGRAADAFELRADVLAPPLLERRRYGTAADLWRALLRELGPGRDPGARLERAASAELDRALRLEGLLRRAADTVRLERGSERTLRVGNIRVAGRLDCGPDPLADGFFLRPDNGEPYRLDLRTIAAADLEELSGLAGVPAELSPDDRLARALLAEAEGDRARAESLLGSGALPAGSESERLLERLALEAPRPAAATELLAILDGNRSGLAGGPGARLGVVDPVAAAVLIDVLLTDQLSEAQVALRANLLRRELRQLEPLLDAGAGARGRIERAYPSARVSVSSAGRVRIEVADGRGWPAGEAPPTDDGAWRLGPGRATLRLDLAEDFDTSAGPWSLELEFAADPERDLEGLGLDLAGYRIVWDGEAGWWAGTASEAPFTGGEAEDLGPGRDGLTPTATDRARSVRVEWDRARASLGVYVDGALCLRAERAPSERSLGESLELAVEGRAGLARLTLEGPLR